MAHEYVIKNGVVIAALSGVLKAATGVVSVAVADTDYQQVVSWGDGLEYTTGTAKVDFNVTNLKITGGEVNTIQDIDTTATPVFAGMTLSGALDMDGQSIDDVGIIFGGTDSASERYLRIGDAGTTAHSLDSEDDLMVTGELEVKGALYVDGAFTPASITMVNNVDEFSTDGSLGDDSDTAVPTEKAVKKYVDDTIISHDTFLELNDTPAAYTNVGAVYAVNGAGDAVAETTVILAEDTNTFSITKGTASLDIAVGAALDIDANLTVTNAVVLAASNAGDIDFGVAGKTLTISLDATIDQDLQKSASVTFADITLENGAQIANKENIDIDTGTETVDSFADTLGDAVQWSYVVKKGANLRAGTIVACWDVTGNTTEYTETHTGDIGDTSGVTFAVDIDSDNVRLQATTDADDVEVRVVRTLI